MSSQIQIKRIYEGLDPSDGYRVLIDRLWPRGVKKETAHLDEWLKTISPSDDLRKWFNHDPEKFKEFRELYIKELADKKDELMRLHKISLKQTVTLLFAAKDELYNNAQVLQDLIRNIK